MSEELNAITFNGTLINDENCNVDICSLEYANFTYVPNLAGNIIFVAIFGLCIPFQLFFGIRHKTWGYMIGMLGGLILEVLGYVGRIQMHFNPFKFDPFLLYLICLTIGPAFLSAAIYLCLGRIVVVYGDHLSRFKPGTYTIVFVSCDLLSLVLQALGGAITATADDDRDKHDMGVNIMIAGLASQVVSLLIFMVLCADFAFKIKRNSRATNAALADVRGTLKWKGFLIALVIATFTIFVRCVFRVAELSEGFDSHLANDEVTYMILEGAMISIASIALTIIHPGVAFAGKWDLGNFSFRNRSTRKGMEKVNQVEV
ncbi:putative RTA1 domain protein [Patellaria atrata CBS 101060]|uniref:RTA1 domain protein n=1 Tax=Patellaria atrata CBS 101060 TaxID=1346257 RepID=A0A9P4SDK1_9PEZI|nr:putative RTA1 domain protein [Patellaria atrata CBS 101060]